MLTLCIRYKLDAHKLPNFEEYARNWPVPIERCGGVLIGYFLPTKFAGPTDLALALINFPGLAAYEQYRERLMSNPAAQENVSCGQVGVHSDRRSHDSSSGRSGSMSEKNSAAITGYDYGRATASRMPVSLEELRQLEETVGWTNEDAKWLQTAAEILVPQSERMVDEWRSAIGRQPHLSAGFAGADGTPDEAYKAAVKRRFVQWVSDICLRPHDEDWLNYQEEIGLRHTPAKKNQTDGGRTPSVVPLRYTIAFTAVVITSIRSFLVSTGRDEGDLERIEAAWTRAVLLSIALWARPYASPGLW
jgi:hypothetical protein